jgi:hypothetical protein
MIKIIGLVILFVLALPIGASAQSIQQLQQQQLQQQE